MAPRRKVVTPPSGADPAVEAAREAVARELVKRARLPRAIAALESSLFGPQRAFVFDTAKRVMSDSGRRSGKTWGLGARILRVADGHPGETIPVFERTATAESARVLWKTLQTINETYNLGASFHNSRLVCTLPNRAEVAILGADTQEAADKARGGRYPAAFVDEAGTFRHHILKYLLDEVLEPALLDFGGSLTLTGTPTPRRQGAFWEAKGNSEYSVHSWTFLDNLALPVGKEREGLDEAGCLAWRINQLQQTLKRLNAPEWRGIVAAMPAHIQREWFGHWAEDDSQLIYKVARLNYCEPDGGPVKTPNLARPGWHYLIGVDVGWNDPCAFVVVAWRRDEPDLWVLESFQEQHLLTDAIAANLDRLRARYPNAPIVMDAGGHGGKLVEQTMVRKYGLRVEAAKKRGKWDRIAFLNSDFVSGRIRIVQQLNRDLIADLLQLRNAPPAPDGTVPDKEHPADDNHLPDALLYAATAVYGIRRGFPDGDAPEAGSPAWAKVLEQRMLDADERQHARRKDVSTTAGSAHELLS